LPSGLLIRFDSCSFWTCIFGSCRLFFLLSSCSSVLEAAKLDARRRSCSQRKARAALTQATLRQQRCARRPRHQAGAREKAATGGGGDCARASSRSDRGQSLARAGSTRIACARGAGPAAGQAAHLPPGGRCWWPRSTSAASRSDPREGTARGPW